MNILVTGGLGVNGVWVVRQLLEEGHRPIILENRMDTSLVPDLAGKLDIVIGDITDLSSIIRVLKEYKIKIVAHLAALMPDTSQLNPMLGFSVNATATVNILEAARIMDVERVVFTSSKSALAPCLGEYGYPTYKPVDETYPAYPAAPTTVYGATKVVSELMGNVYNEQYGFGFISLRFASIYGPGKGARHGIYALYGNMIENAMFGRPTVIARGGEEKNDVVYVKDVANAVVLSCFARNLKHRLFHIGTGNAYRYGDFVDSIRKIYPKAVFDIGSGILQPPGNTSVMNIARAREELGYAPRYQLDEGIRDYITEIKKLNK